MKICMLTSDHSPFDGRIFHKEAVSLRKKYPQICVMAPYNGGRTFEKGIEIIALREPRGPLETLRMLLGMPRIGSRTYADVYHCHEPESLWVAGRITRGGRGKLVYDAHEYYADRFAERFPTWFRPPVQWLLDIGERILCRNTDYAITVCEELAEKFRNWGHRVALVENLALEAEDCHHEFVIQRKDNAKIGIYVGGLYRERGILEMVKAASIVQERGIAVRLIFVGPCIGRFLEEAQGYVKSLHMEDYVDFVGRVPFECVPGYLRGADFGLVMLYPEKRFLNAVSVKLFEYMQAGLPVLANDLPATAEIVREAQCGMLANPLDPEDIADAMVRLLSDEESKRTMGQNASQAFSEKYTWTLAEKRLLEVYDQLEKEL